MADTAIVTVRVRHVGANVTLGVIVQLDTTDAFNVATTTVNVVLRYNVFEFCNENVKVFV